MAPVIFKLRLCDLVIFALSHYARHWTFWLFFVLIVGGVLGLEFLINLEREAISPFSQAAKVASYWAVAYVLLQTILISAATCSRGNKFVLTDYTVTMDEVGLIEHSRYRTLTLPWEGVWKVKKYPSQLAIYFEPSRAVLVPARAFTGPQDLHAFEKRIREQSSAA